MRKKTRDNLIETVMILALIVGSVHIFSQEAEAYIIKQDAREARIEERKDEVMRQCLNMTENGQWCIDNLL